MIDLCGEQSSPENKSNESDVQSVLQYTEIHELYTSIYLQ